MLLGLGPASWLVMHRFRRSAAPAFAAEAAAEADLMTAVAETIRTRSLLRQATRAGQGRLLGRLDVLGDRALAAQQRTVVVARWLNAMALVEGIGLAALLGLGAVLVLGVAWLGTVSRR